MRAKHVIWYLNIKYHLICVHFKYNKYKPEKKLNQGTEYVFRIPGESKQDEGLSRFP